MIHQPGDFIKQRYQILEPLGRGGSGLTYKARDRQSEQLVAIKVLSLSHLDTWKQIELFEREVQILQQLNHPSIPKYLDRFQADTEEGDRLFYIIQQLAPGKSLATLVEEGWQPNEREVKQIAIQILEILASLQELIPPVIHRDIKPQNIIYGDQKLFLVDFGAVQDIYHQTALGSTVVGTYGYMAPEQFRGQAQLPTDLYGLGTTLLFLLTGKHPADLPYRKLKIDFRSQVRISKPFANWIDKLIEPDPKQRCSSAREALEVLQGKAFFAQVQQPPSYTSIEIQKTEDTLTITIPPALFRKRCHPWRLGLGAAWYFIVAIAFMICAASLPPLWGWCYGLMFILSLLAFNSDWMSLSWISKQFKFPENQNLILIKSAFKHNRVRQKNNSTVSSVLVMPFKFLSSLIAIKNLLRLFCISSAIFLSVTFSSTSPTFLLYIILFCVFYLIFKISRFRFETSSQSKLFFKNYLKSNYIPYLWIITIQILLLSHGFIDLIENQFYEILFISVLILDFLVGTGMKRIFLSELIWIYEIQASWESIKRLEYSNSNQTFNSNIIFKIQSKLFKLSTQEIHGYLDKDDFNRLYFLLKLNPVSIDLSKELHTYLLTNVELNWLLNEISEFIKRTHQTSFEGKI